jgi:predicted SAM-dependent methyltransferase
MDTHKKLTIKQRLGALLIPRLPVTRENFDRLRFEFNAFRINLNNRINPFAIYKVRRQRAATGLSVNVGAGPFGSPDWVNIDMFNYKGVNLVYDCRKKLPFRDTTVDRIRCEHVFEHLDRKDEAPEFLSECYRCLRTGGILRIVVPDLELFVRAYVSGDRQQWQAIGFDLDHLPWGLETPMDILNHTFRQNGEHKYGYDFETLRITAAAAGFSKITKLSWGSSEDPKLRGDLENHRPYSLYVDCLK